MTFRKAAISTLFVCLLLPAAAVGHAIPRAIVVNDQRLYRDADVDSRTVGRILAGEEANIINSAGSLLKLSLPGDRTGWTLANGVVVLENNPRAAALLYEAADTLAREDSADAWQTAARLFRKAASVSSAGAYAADAMARAAELAWKAEFRKTGNVTDAGAGRELAAVVQTYPKTPAAARAAFLLLRNNLCELWEGTPGCPEVEIGLIERYLAEYSEAETAAELRYAVAYRHSALVEIYLQQDKPHFSAEKAVAHKQKARETVEELMRQHPGGLWAARGERLLWCLENNEGVYSSVALALTRF